MKCVFSWTVVWEEGCGRERGGGWEIDEVKGGGIMAEMKEREKVRKVGGETVSRERVGEIQKERE